MKHLIAEISAMHGGSLTEAMQLIQIAKRSGATLVKSQAFDPRDMKKYGTMPPKFYDRVHLSIEECEELIEYGDYIGIPVFFSVISKSYGRLKQKQKFNKIFAAQYSQRSAAFIQYHDSDKLFVSIRNFSKKVPLKKARIMYAQPYLGKIQVSKLNAIRKFYNRPVGISHHHRNMESLFNLIKERSIPQIEKHFYLGDKLKFKTAVYRDCLHAAGPQDFTLLAKAYLG